MELDRLSRVAEIRLGDAEIAESAALGPSITDLSGDDQNLVIEFHRFVVVAETGIGKAEIAERIGLALSVVVGAGAGEAAFEPDDPVARVEA